MVMRCFEMAFRRGSRPPGDSVDSVSSDKSISCGPANVVDTHVFEVAVEIREEDSKVSSRIYQASSLRLSSAPQRNCWHAKPRTFSSDPYFYTQFETLFPFFFFFSLALFALDSIQNKIHQSDNIPPRNQVYLYYSYLRNSAEHRLESVNRC